MYALALTLLLPNAVFGFSDLVNDKICFDMEPRSREADYEDDKYSETTNKVCAWQDGVRQVCKTGVYKSKIVYGFGCILFPKKSLSTHKQVYVEIHGDDAMWIDRFLLLRVNKRENGYERKWWGVDNDNGWCMSEDRNDYNYFNGNGLKQYVPAKECYYKFRLNTSGSVSGWRTNMAKRCKVSKKMGCKEACPRGWHKIRSENVGCCKSFGNCGGNRKVCVGEVNCRRRTEDDNDEDGYWVEVSE